MRRVGLTVDPHIWVNAHVTQGVNPKQAFLHGGIVIGQHIDRRVLAVPVLLPVGRIPAQAPLSPISSQAK